MNRFSLEQQQAAFPDIWANVLREVELETAKQNARRPVSGISRTNQESGTLTEPNVPRRQSTVAKDTLDFAIDSLPQNATLLIDASEDAKTPVEIKTALLAKANELLSDSTTQVTRDGQTDFDKGRLMELQGSLTSAIQHYETAIKANPSKHAWRFRLVEALEQQQEYKFAEEHLKRCLLQSPRNEQYRNKLRSLHTKTNTRRRG